MGQVPNARDGLPDVTWRKSARSGKQGNCVELAPVPAHRVAVRNSRFPEGPALVFSAAEMSAFLADIKRGAYDDLLGPDDIALVS
ncbi:DUF397 domain-containing protein [Actinomycetospora straminea]|uniref:DUF397 domain-containing protein n=1 Tax=Actinomycetospora straminea TaxID=663607 RepID=A0ABP9DU01_9PSEU|nr:DUF397 domain-containing protein [Actinomycetospora straminea]MDD7935196.1 DUF397 domain-containing protein [Actinomycetospora straminea]